MKAVITTKENDVKVCYCNYVTEYNGKINLYSVAEGKVDVTRYDGDLSKVARYIKNTKRGIRI